jgi:O-antigen/teichoic acid export membrane protein
MKMLDSHIYGKVSLGKSILHFFDISHLGTRYGLDRLLPETRLRSEKVASEIFSAGFILNAFFSALLVIFWFFYEIKDVIFYCSFYISGFLYALITSYRIFFRAGNNKKTFIELTFISTFLISTAQLVAFLIFGINGYLISSIVSYFIVYIIVSKRYKIVVKVSLKRFIVITKTLFDKGWLLFISALISYLAIFGDRFFIAKYAGLTHVADFSVVMFFFSIFSIFATTYTDMIMNKIVCFKSIKFVLKESVQLFFLSACIAFLLYFFLPLFIDLVMPKYLRIIPYVNIILLFAIPYAILPVVNYYLQALDKRKQLLTTNIISTVVYFFLLLFVLIKKMDFKYIIYARSVYLLLIVMFNFSLAIIYSNSRLR